MSNMTNPTLIRATLKSLKAFDGHAVTESALGSHIELNYGENLTTAAVREALLVCRDQGWASKREDAIEGTLWVITQDGKSR